MDYVTKPTNEYINSLQKLCYEFVWNKKKHKNNNKKTDKINRKTVHNSVQDGGLDLPHLKTFVSALKVTRIRKFINTHHKWTNIALV